MLRDVLIIAQALTRAYTKALDPERLVLQRFDAGRGTIYILNCRAATVLKSGLYISAGGDFARLLFSQPTIHLLHA